MDSGSGEPRPGPEGEDQGDRGDGTPGRSGDGEQRGDDGPLLEVTRTDAALVEARERALPGLARRERALSERAEAARDRGEDGSRRRGLRLEDRWTAARLVAEASQLRYALGRYEDGDDATRASQKLLEDALSFADAHFLDDPVPLARAHAEIAIDQLTTRPQDGDARDNFLTADELFEDADARGLHDPAALRAAQGRLWRRFGEALIDQDRPVMAGEILDDVSGWSLSGDRAETLPLDRAILLGDLHAGTDAPERGRGIADDIAGYNRDLSLRRGDEVAATYLAVAEHAFDAGNPEVGWSCLDRARTTLRDAPETSRTRLGRVVAGLTGWFWEVVPFELGDEPPPSPAALERPLRQLNEAGAYEAGLLHDLSGRLRDGAITPERPRALRPALSLRRLSDLGAVSRRPAGGRGSG